MPDQTALEARQGEAALSLIENNPKTCGDDIVGVEPQNPSKPKICSKCGEKALIKGYGMLLCAKHGLEYLKDMNYTKKHGILF